LKETFLFEVLLSGRRQSTYYYFNFQNMKNSTKLISGLFAIAIVITAVASISSVSAYQGDPSVQGPNHSLERHEEMSKAFENTDYNAWKTLMDQNDRKGRVMDTVNEDNFKTFVEAHNLAAEGKIDEAKALRSELGLGLKNGTGQGRYGNGTGQGLKDGSGQGRGRGMKLANNQ